MRRKPGEHNENPCREITSGVYQLEVGKGLTRVNVYFVTSGVSWVLIDTGMADDSLMIMKAARSLFGADTRPAAILLTHDHPDHAGSALRLACEWNCAVYLHPKELPLAKIKSLETVEEFAIPIDRWIVLPILRRMSKERVDAIFLKSNFEKVAQAIDTESAPPGLPDWKFIYVPGHSPGHVAFFRPKDRVLICGDALMTINLNSIIGVLLWIFRLCRPRLSSSPYFMSWNWPMAKQAVAVLAGLKPRVIASGHGTPLSGDNLARELSDLAEKISGTE